MGDNYPLHITQTHTHTHLINDPLSGTTRVSQYHKSKTNLDFTEARDKLVAVASAGPQSSLHLAPDRKPRQHPTTGFLQAGFPSCRPTNRVKALKAQALHITQTYSNLTANFYENTH